MADEHVHRFCGITFYDNQHRHRYGGTTGPPIGGGPAHIHNIIVRTTVDLGHDHEIKIETGPGIAIPGGHVHRFKGITSKSGETPHTHRFLQATGPQIYARSKFIASQFNLPTLQSLIEFFTFQLFKGIRINKHNSRSKKVIKKLVRNLRKLLI
ncbi:MAG: hypothetical protein HPY81_06635 [Firmicutes bacterium]|nr:hypothetical protein [Bacillota bacterium]